jgi:hypothetical protein
MGVRETREPSPGPLSGFTYVAGESTWRVQCGFRGSPATQADFLCTTILSTHRNGPLPSLGKPRSLAVGTSTLGRKRRSQPTLRVRCAPSGTASARQNVVSLWSDHRARLSVRGPTSLAG